MATVKNTISLQDKFTPTLKTIIKAMNTTVLAMSEMDKVSSKAFDKVKRDVKAASDALDNMERETKQVKKASEETGKGFKDWGANLGGAIYAAKEIFNTVSKIALKMDEINARGARADMVGGLYGIDGSEIEKMVQDAATASRGNFGTMMTGVGKMGIMAKDAFKSPKELIDFNEQLQKTFVIAGTTAGGIDSAMLQMTQALASGTLRGEEFNAIFEAAPNIIQRVAEYTGKSTGEMRQMAQDGLLTAEVVKYAMLAATEETNAAFNGMPMSFQAVMNRIQSDVDGFLQPIAEKMGAFWGFLIDHWNVVQPILIGISVALGVLAVGLGVAAVAQWALNSAMLANPMTWVILAIVAVIAIIVILVLWIIDLWQTNMDFKYGVIKIWNGILGFFDRIPLFFMMVGYGIADAFSFAKVAVLETMQNMADESIDIINNLINLLNKIPGVAIAPIGQLTIAGNVAAEEEAKRQARSGSIAAENSRILSNDAAREAQAAADRADDTAALAARRAEAEAAKNLKAEIPAYESLASAKAGKGVKVGGGSLDSVGKIDEAISITDEDIKMLKDIAATEFINKYTTLTPNMTVTFGDIHETADANKLLAVMEDMVEQAYASVLIGEGA